MQPPKLIKEHHFEQPTNWEFRNYFGDTVEDLDTSKVRCSNSMMYKLSEISREETIDARALDFEVRCETTRT